jgi:histidinol-phosphate aminotransferase
VSSGAAKQIHFLTLEGIIMSDTAIAGVAGPGGSAAVLQAQLAHKDLLSSARHKVAEKVKAPLTAGYLKVANLTSRKMISAANRLVPKPKAAPWFSPAARAAMAAPYNVGPLVPYEPGTLRLASNESAHGPSPKVREARMALADDPRVGRYPDPYSVELNNALRQLHNIPQNDPKVAVVSTPGASVSLSELSQMLLTQGRNAVTSQYAYKPFAAAVGPTGATCKVLPSPGGAIDLEGMRRAINSKTSLVYLDNPGNPTGLTIPPDKLERFIADVKRDHPHVTVIVDAAYDFFATPEMRPDLPGLVREHGVIVLQTLSKIHALPEVRLGFALCRPDIAKAWNDFRPIYPISLDAQVIGAAAVKDVDYVEFCRKDNEQARNQLQGGLKALGLEFLPSQTNFVTIFIDGDVKGFVDRALSAHKIAVRDVGILAAFRVSLPKAGDETGRVLAMIDGEIKAGRLSSEGSKKSAEAFSARPETKQSSLSIARLLTGETTRLA